MKIEYTEKDIAKYALCSESNVIKAEQRGKFRLDDFGSVVEFVILMRMKELGVSGWIDGMPRAEVEKAKFPKMVTAESLGIQRSEAVQDENDLGYEPDDSQIEGEW